MLSTPDACFWAVAPAAGAFAAGPQALSARAAAAQATVIDLRTRRSPLLARRYRARDAALNAKPAGGSARDGQLSPSKGRSMPLGSGLRGQCAALVSTSRVGRGVIQTRAAAMAKTTAQARNSWLVACI